jgi:hypothetical protein
MKIRMFMLLGGALASSSCILPIPHRRVHASGIEGKVLAATTREPITGAEVSSAISGKKLAMTDSDGMFRIKPEYGWHGAYLIGPISYSLLPHFDMPYPAPPIRIAADGYRAGEFRGPELSDHAEFQLNRR